MTLNVMALNDTQHDASKDNKTQCKATLHIAMALNITTINVMALKILTLNIIVLNIMAFNVMAHSIMTLNVMTLHDTQDAVTEDNDAQCNVT